MISFSMRAVAVVLTFIYTLLALTTCGAQPPAGEEPASESSVSLGQSGPVVVNILQCRGEISLPLQQAVAAYQQEKGDVRISVQTVENRAEYQTALRAKLLSGEKVDIFHLFSRQDLTDVSRYAADLSDMTWLRGAVEGILEPVSTDDGIYGIPYSLEGMGLIANKKIFAAAGISLEEMSTFDGLRAAFDKLREQILAGDLAEDFPHLETVTELPLRDNDFVSRQLAEVALGNAFASPAEAAASSRFSLASPGALEDYFSLLASYTSNRVYWAGLQEVTLDAQVEGGIAEGRVAIVQQNVASYRQIAKIDPDLAKDLVLLPIPLDDGDTPGVYIGAPAYWAVNTDSSEEAQALARDFLTWLYCSETGSRLVAEQFGAVSPFRDTAADTAVPLHNQMLNYLNQGETRLWLHGEAPRGWGSEVFAPGLRQWLAGEVEWETFLQDCAASWTAAVAVASRY